ncbi:MAG: DNA polymerase III subunit delta [Candidatus Cloacimonadota bacterium]|nr:MAG: DNA polymerase III subunit delta [Candidatus Cloacimonadota bacterium]
MAESIQPDKFLLNPKKYLNYPIIVVSGEDAYYRDLTLDSALKRLIAPENREFDYFLCYGEDVRAEEVLVQLEMIPFMNDVRVTVLKNFDSLRTEDKNSLAKYAENPSLSSKLILTANKLDQRLNSIKSILKNAVHITCKSAYNVGDIVKWLKQRLVAEKITMEPKAVDFFSNMTDLDYLEAENTFQKILIHAGDSQMIHLEDVKECLGHFKAGTIFELQNAIGNRAKKKAVLTLESMLENGENAIMIITMLTGFFTVLWKINALRRGHIGFKEIKESHLKNVFWKYRDDYIKFSSNYKLKSLRKCFGILYRTDFSLKSLNVKENILLELMLLDILNS